MRAVPPEPNEPRKREQPVELRREPIRRVAERRVNELERGTGMESG
jgi:hypothetical protein